jgi:ligand-binding sensor domain-containing protein
MDCRSVTALLEDHEILWAGGRGGLSRLINGRWERIDDAHGLTSEAVTGLFEDQLHALWVATLRGLYQRRAGDRHSTRHIVISCAAARRR